MSADEAKAFLAPARREKLLRSLEAADRAAETPFNNAMTRTTRRSARQAGDGAKPTETPRTTASATRAWPPRIGLKGFPKKSAA
jgi:hypothetical protein